MSLRFLLLLGSLCAYVTAAGIHGDSLKRTVVQNNGDGMDSFNVELDGLAPGEKLVSAHLEGVDKRIATHVNINPVKTGNGYNLTANIDTAGKLGNTPFTLVAKTDSGRKYTKTGSLHVVGVRFPRKKVLQSGRANALTAQVEGGKLSDCRVGVHGKNAFIKDGDVTVAGNTLLVRPKSGGGTGKAKIVVDCPTIGRDGESAETEIDVEPSSSLASSLEKSGGSSYRSKYAPSA